MLGTDNYCQVLAVYILWLHIHARYWYVVIPRGGTGQTLRARTVWIARMTVSAYVVYLVQKITLYYMTLYVYMYACMYVCCMCECMCHS
eukprot:COSAG01_NODE_2278_length_7990_cov_4.925167_3_plen_89_part_00